ncbi:hypothetical protein ACS0TY_015345 [Phlomoides rotata]
MVARILGLACVNLSEMVMGIGSNMIGRIVSEVNMMFKVFKREGLMHFYMKLRLKKMEEEEEDTVDVLIKLKEEKPCSIHISWNHIKAMLTVDLDRACRSRGVSVVYV